MTTRSFGAPLEQTCQRPGLWHIEGHVVVRVHGRRKHKSWWIYRPADAEWCPVVASSLTEARDWIRQEINR